MTFRHYPLPSILTSVIVSGIMSFLAMGSGVPTAWAEASKGTRKPNFIIIFTDDQGYQDLGVLVHPQFEPQH